MQMDRKAFKSNFMFLPQNDFPNKSNLDNFSTENGMQIYGTNQFFIEIVSFHVLGD